MHTNSLPPSDRDETANTDAPTPTPSDTPHKIHPCNAAIRDKLRALRASSPIYSNAQLGAKLGYSSSVLSQYLSDDGNKWKSVSALETKAEDFLQALERRRASGVETTNCDIAKEMLDAFNNIRADNDLGLIVYDSGGGKTRGIELIRKKHDLVKLVEVTEWNRSVHDIEDAIWSACAVDGWNRCTKRFPYLVQKMRGTDIPFIFDDAHKASRDALSLIATFQEKTGCPVALFGVALLVDKIKSDASGQLPSRVGIHWAIQSAYRDGAALRHTVREIAKDVNGELDELLELCAQVAEHEGHLRAVKKQLTRAKQIRLGDDSLTWLEAFRAAHGKLLRQYKLT